MSTIEEILSAVKDLPPQEQAELRRRLELLTSSHDKGGELEGGDQRDVEDLHARIHRAMYAARVG